MSFDELTVIDQFRLALQGRAIAPPPKIIADGKLHRCDAEGKKGKLGAAYKLCLKGIPAGGFQNWHDGRGWEKWKSDVEDTRTPAQKARDAREIEKRRMRQAEEHRQNQAAARERADWIWYHCEEAPPDFPYLLRKGVPPIGLGLYKGALVIPMRDIHGILHSLQLIQADGKKAYLKFGRVEGCFFGVGTPGETIYVVEGYATAGSLHLATGMGVAVGFDSGNLLHVAQALRDKYPTRQIVMGSDDDILNILRDKPLPNAGLVWACESARAVTATVAVPQFPPCLEADVDPFRRVRASAFRPIASAASLDPAFRFYQRGILPRIDPWVDQQMAALQGLSTLDRLTWGTIILHLRDSGILADETDFNDMHTLIGLDAVRECIARAVPAPSREVQDLSFNIAV